MKGLLWFGQSVGAILLTLSVGVFLTSTETWLLSTIGLLNKESFYIFGRIVFIPNMIMFVLFLKRQFTVENV